MVYTHNPDKKSPRIVHYFNQLPNKLNHQNDTS